VEGGVERVRSVPVPAFSVFMDANRATVYRFLAVAVGPSEADDVFQETFLSALRAYPRLTSGDRLDRWILKIASRKAIDHHRARRRRPEPSEEIPEEPVAPPSVPDDGLWSAVAALPPKQRVAVVHRHVLDRPYSDIAAVLDCTEEAARASVHEGLKRLRESVR
jgi:RNA polymerase sigma factor (sigma-70 family)